MAARIESGQFRSSGLKPMMGRVLKIYTYVIKPNYSLLLKAEVTFHFNMFRVCRQNNEKSAGILIKQIRISSLPFYPSCSYYFRLTAF